MQDPQVNTGQYDRVAETLPFEFPRAVASKVTVERCPMFDHLCWQDCQQKGQPDRNYSTKRLMHIIQWHSVLTWFSWILGKADACVRRQLLTNKQQSALGGGATATSSAEEEYVALLLLQQ